jgi:Winged helix-turn helix
MLNIHELKAAYEKAISHRTSNSTVYSLLAWHGWRGLMPRPFHPDRDVEAQNAFKKRVFLMLSGKLGGPLRPALVVYGSCSPTKRGSAGSTALDHAGRQRG